MSQGGIVGALFCYLLLAITTSAETTATKSYTITKDPQAAEIVAQALAAMGGFGAIAGYQDSLATGTVTVYFGSSQESFPVTLKSKGTHQTRVEMQMPEGTNIRIMNQGRAAIQKPDETVQSLGTNNTVAERVSHIPLLSLLAEYKSPDINLTCKGTALVNGQSTNVIAISFVPYKGLAEGRIFAAITKTLFYVDKATGLVDKVQYENYEEGNSQQSHRKIEDYLTQYQNIDGISVPFHQVTYANGKPEADLLLKSITFNVGLPDSDFTLPVRGLQ